MRSSQPQRFRTQDNPLFLGTFDQLSVRCLQGALGPVNQVVGRADTRSTSNGGYGGGTYNHWFSLGLASPAWIIITKGGPRPNYIQLSVYDLNLIPIEGRAIFDADSITSRINGTTAQPYIDHVMGQQSNLYNNSVPRDLDKGNQQYYPLGQGTYMICISTTRNEPLDYEVAFVVEFPVTDFDILLEDYAYSLYENVDFIEADTINGYAENDLHAHSLSEWDQAWQREHQQGTPFPEILVPLATQP
jgi:hypothetical protein